VKCFIDKHVVLSRLPEGPLAAYIGPFAESLRAQGYAAVSIHKQVLLAACFSRWLKQRGVSLRSVTSDHPTRYLRYRARQVRPYLGDAAALSHVLAFLRRKRVIAAEKIPSRRLTSAERCTQAYEHHLREARGLARATIINYVPFIRSFLKDCFDDGPVTLSYLCPGRREICTAPGGTLAPEAGETPNLCATLFPAVCALSRQDKAGLGCCGPNRCQLVDVINSPSHYRGSSRQLLSSINRRTAIGRRDYAIVPLLARLGLRAGEVASLELGDIDWKAGQLSVRGKTGQRSELPLTAEVGKVIAAYLRGGRPQSTSRRVFLRAKAPVGGFRGASGVGSIVRHRLQRAGIDAPTFGAHQFRHGLASGLLRHGASLGEIGELLGHHNPETTEIYIKVDLDALRTLALPWPGGVR
jgi:integrase/recombinase XerD